MSHPDKPLKILFGIVCIGFLILFSLLIAFSISQPEDVGFFVKLVIVVATVGCYFALFALWIYWLRYFWRTSQTGQFWLCLLVPYFHAAYKTAKYLRAPPSGGA
ncbi:hypothetical protein OVA13_12910 [Pseudoxanthomonas sp. SL93]|uniref:hypothetical protein n=1 Tax=Pseudoxanthomonas sp. SL93 TaxID=2995142 RepID=UPI0022712ED3|nr:hypothetical protein [Pseudoxanthomonas sp. SL93]WAC62285.1 hypothetical protein OVA13_12910 [Pseudoxanthomonas sp. SL93]